MKVFFRSNAWFWLLFLAIFFGLPAVRDRSLVQGVPPPVQARLLDGREFAWGDLGSQPVLLYFWASWCPVCRTMQSSIQSLTEGRAVITVALQSGTKEEIRAYLEKNGLRWQVIPDATGSVAESYGLRGVPALFFIDRRGQIRFTATGYTTEMGMRFRFWLMDKFA